MPITDKIREQITRQIIEALQANDLPPWRQPWRSHPNAGAPANIFSKQNYRGINPLVLQATAMQKGFRSRWWATFNQWQEADCQIRKGQRGTQIVLYKPVTKDGDEDESSYLLMRSFTVFNAEQCFGAEAFHATTAAMNSVEPDFAHADDVIEATGAKIQHGYDRACYSRVQDLISLPSKSQFITLADYYETAFHELVHWTEHPSRLNWNRTEGGYALGELIAEIGACFVVTELGLPNSNDLSGHASYLKHWLDGMRGDSKFIFRAAAHASRAADFILSFSKVKNEPLELV